MPRTMPQEEYQQPPNEKASRDGAMQLGLGTEAEVTSGSPPSTVPSPAPEDGVATTAAPNGGLVAWLQVAGCFALYLNTL